MVAKETLCILYTETIMSVPIQVVSIVYAY